jgi:DNA replicative helicase MCM subunit Mcm2 (Cdc46/Mcm family)
MTKKTYECKECSCEATIDFNYDEVGEEPTFCPFCGNTYIQEEIDKMEYPLDDAMDDGW